MRWDGVPGIADRWWVLREDAVEEPARAGHAFGLRESGEGVGLCGLGGVGGGVVDMVERGCGIGFSSGCL